MHLGGQNGARWTSQMYLDKVGKQGQIMPGIPRQANLMYPGRYSGPSTHWPEGEARSVRQGKACPHPLSTDPEPSSHRHRNLTCNLLSLMSPGHRVDGGVELV